MDTEQAIRDVQEIKKIMKDSRQKSSRARVWGGLMLILTAMILCIILPILSPLFGTGLLVFGIITIRNTNDSLEKGIAITAISIGGLLILATIVIFTLGFGSITDVSTTSHTISID